MPKHFERSFAMGVIGVVAGVTIAIGVPAVVLALGEGVALGNVTAGVLCFVAIMGGVVLACVAFFFSIAIPTSQEEAGDEGEEA